MASGIGATIAAPEGTDPVAAFFGEDQGRYLVTVRADALDALKRREGVSAMQIGTTGGPSLKLGEAHAISVAELKAAHEGWFAGFMGN
jgi:phosphoribosylformylglycinamidine synthase